MTERKRILIVDDDKFYATMVTRILENSYVCEQHENAQNALTAYKQFEPHLILTDFQMPGMDGYELAKALRQDGYQGRITLMTTSAAYARRLHDDLDNHFDEVLQKGQGWDSFTGALDRLLSQ